MSEVGFIWLLSGSGPDGAEEIKRHIFYSTIDWNVSALCLCPVMDAGRVGEGPLPTVASAVGGRR